MSINIGNKKSKLYLGSTKVSKAYLGSTKVYSSGNVVTYYVDENTVYKEEVEEGESCLEPRTFTPTREGYIFSGWSNEPGGNALESIIMKDAPITLYAVWVGTPHYFTPLDSVTWEKTSADAWSVAEDRNNLKVSSSYIEVEVKKGESTYNYGYIYATANVPTGGCTKVRLKLSTGGYGEVYESPVTVGSTSIQPTRNSHDKYYEFNISGDSVRIVLGAIDATAYFSTWVRLTEIYFYN